jgi:hypothetical protein
MSSRKTQTVGKQVFSEAVGPISQGMETDAPGSSIQTRNGVTIEGLGHIDLTPGAHEPASPEGSGPKFVVLNDIYVGARLPDRDMPNVYRKGDVVPLSLLIPNYEQEDTNATKAEIARRMNNGAIRPAVGEEAGSEKVEITPFTESAEAQAQRDRIAELERQLAEKNVAPVTTTPTVPTTPVTTTPAIPAKATGTKTIGDEDEEEGWEK